MYPLESQLGRYPGIDPNLGSHSFVQARLPLTMDFHVPGLTRGTIYYGRVDEIEANAIAVHKGMSGRSWPSREPHKNGGLIVYAQRPSSRKSVTHGSAAAFIQMNGESRKKAQTRSRAFGNQGRGLRPGIRCGGREDVGLVKERIRQ